MPACYCDCDCSSIVGMIAVVYVIEEGEGHDVGQCIALSLLSMRLSVDPKKIAGGRAAVCLWVKRPEEAQRLLAAIPAVGVDAWALPAERASIEATLDVVRGLRPEAKAALFLGPNTVVTRDVASVAMDLLDDVTLFPGRCVAIRLATTEGAMMPVLARTCAGRMAFVESPVAVEGFVAALERRPNGVVGVRNGCGLHVGARDAGEMSLALVATETVMRTERERKRERIALADEHEHEHEHAVAYYAVLLTGRPERVAKVEAATAELGSARVEVVEAVDGAREMDEGALGRLVEAGFLSASSPLPKDEFTGARLRPNNVAAFLSHRRALEHVVANGDAFAVILEDDVSLRPRFKEAVQRVVGSMGNTSVPDVVQLHVMPNQRMSFAKTWEHAGGICASRDDDWGLEDCPKGIWGMQAYLVTAAAARALLAPGGLWPMRGAVDEQLSRLSQEGVIRLRALVGFPTIVDEDTRSAPSVTNQPAGQPHLSTPHTHPSRAVTSTPTPTPQS